jgi:TP901 family phage tail tape measure protein
MANGDFLAKIKLALEGKEQVVSGLKQTQQAAQKLTGTKVTTIFDAQGVATGKQIQDTFKNLNDTVPKTKSIIGEFGTVMKKALIVAPVWIILRSAIMGTMQALAALPQAAIAWEKEMAQIKRVGKGTEGEYALLSTRLLDLAKNYGVASATIGQGAALWAQQGKSLTEIVPLMETTIKLSLITGKTVSESVEDITAIMKSYGIEANATIGILDKLIKVEQEHAITTDVLTDAMKKGGPVAAQFGVSFEKFLGIITATHVATRASGGEIGNAWKTIFARMATSAIPAIQNIAKVPVYMDKAGKSTYQNTGTFRDWGKVLDEVMVSMGTLSETQQMSLVSALAMKRTLNYLLSAYQNWDEGVKATVESLDSFGASDKALNVLLGTTASKTQQLQSAWSELGVTIVNNGQGIKDTIDLLKGMVGGASDIVMLFHGMAGAELQAAKVAKEGLDSEIAYRTKQKGQLTSILGLQKLLGESKEFETRIKEDPKLGDDQKSKILTVIAGRQKFIQETLDKQPKIEVGELFLEATLVRGAELQKLRDKITTMAVEAPTHTLPFDFGKELAGEIPVDKLEAKLKSIKGIKPEFIVGKEEEYKKVVSYLEMILSLKKDEAKMMEPEYLGTLEERLKNEKEFLKINKEYLEDDAALTSQQKEQINLEREMATYAIQRGVTEEDILQKRIEMLKVSEQFTAEQQRTLAIEQVQTQLAVARLKTRKEEEDSLMNLSMQYEKADMLKKGDIRRTAELSMKTPEDLSTAYQGSEYDKRLIEENLSQFTQAQRDAVAQTTQLWKDLSGSLGALTPEQKQLETKTMWEKIKGETPTTQLTQNVVGAQKIDIIVNGKQMTAEEIAGIISGQISSNPEFRKAIADAAVNTNVPK